MSFAPFGLRISKYHSCVGPFLKEFVKGKRFSSGLLRTGSAGRTSSVPWFIGRGQSRVLAVVTFWHSSRLSSLREVAIVLCRRDCSQLIPLQVTAHAYREQLCPVKDPGRCGRIWCEFLTVRATPSKATCCW